MSRTIDLDGDLTEDDVRYLKDRPWLIAEAKFQGFDDIEDRMAAALAGDLAPDEVTNELVNPNTDYHSLNLAQLKDMAAGRGLETKGGVKVLIERLTISDNVGSTVSREAEGAIEGENAS